MTRDFGHGDLGFYGLTVIQTPDLELMAEAVIRCTDFYAGPPVFNPSNG